MTIFLSLTDEDIYRLDNGKLVNKPLKLYDYFRESVVAINIELIPESIEDHE